MSVRLVYQLLRQVLQMLTQLARDGELRILQDADLQDLRLVTAGATPGTP